MRQKVTMTLSHIRLTVSDLHSASSFFLSCLQPLGYKFIRHQGSEIALGPAEADFFLVQETAG